MNRMLNKYILRSVVFFCLISCKVYGAVPITYGSTIKLLFPSIPNAGLHSHAIPYQSPGSTNQQQVTGTLKADADDLWVVFGPNGDATQMGQKIQSGMIISLAFPANNGILHSHVNVATLAPGQNQTLFEVTGGNLSAVNVKACPVGDTGDNWVVMTSDGQPWTTSSQVILTPVTGNLLNGLYLVVSSTQFDVRQSTSLAGPDFHNIVGVGFEQAFWQAAMITVASAAPVTPTTFAEEPAIIQPVDIQDEVEAIENIMIEALSDELDTWGTVLQEEFL